MDVPALLLATALSLVFLVVLFRPLEVLFPARPGQPLLRPGWRLDLCFLLGQYLLWNAVVFGCLAWSQAALGGLVPPDFRAAVAAWPFALQVAAVVVLSDFCVYWGHRLQHRVGFLWRFHAVHHSAEHLDWLAAHREHPVDTVYTLTLINLPAFVLGFPLAALAGFVAFRGVWAIYIHSNVRLPLGPLRVLLGAPELHHWHHARDRDAGNYGNVCPLMDLIFGTYRCPDREPESFGVNQPTPQTYAGQLARPLLPPGGGAGGRGGVQSEVTPDPEATVSKLVIVDDQMKAKLDNGGEPVLLCAADGTVMGYFTPATATPPKLNLQPQVGEEELRRREAAGGGRKLADILRDLEARA